MYVTKVTLLKMNGLTIEYPRTRAGKMMKTGKMFCSDGRGQTAYLWSWENKEEKGERAESESVCKVG